MAVLNAGLKALLNVQIVTARLGCLIGMIEKDSGEIWMNQNVGVCLQFDMCYEELSVSDNMKVVLGIKGEIDEKYID